MLETVIIFYAAHLVADFVLQTNWIAANKTRPLVLGLHIVIVIAATALLAGTANPLLLLLVGGSHLAIDVWKQIWGGKGLFGFALDQTAHLASLIVIAALFPQTFIDGIWSQILSWQNPGGVDRHAYLWLLTIISGLIVTLRMGGFAIDLFIAKFGYTPSKDDPGLENGGFYIGLLERAMIFVLVLTNQIAGIGFLVAAKSILRFGISQDRKTGEYVIIGTLASFLWALIVAFLTQFVLARLGH